MSRFGRVHGARLIERRALVCARFKALASLLGPGTGPISVSELEGRMRGFGDALNAFDDFDNGDNSIFAVFDGLIALRTAAEKARGSSLTFTSTKDGAEHTKVFALQAVTSPPSPLWRSVAVGVGVGPGHRPIKG
jgi:hypothetical protein